LRRCLFVLPLLAAPVTGMAQQADPLSLLAPPPRCEAPPLAVAAARQAQAGEPAPLRRALHACLAEPGAAPRPKLRRS
jgi:hypothetical protein